MPDHSRLARLGAGASGRSEGDVLEHLGRSCVHLSIDRSLPGAWLSLRVALTTLRRMPGRIHLDRRGLNDDEVRLLEDTAHKIDPQRGLEVGETLPHGAVQLHIGTQAPSPSAIRAVPDGYGVQVVRDAAVNILQARPAHPLGSVVTAAFAVSETFKDIAPVVEARRQNHAYMTWCPVGLSADLTVAPMIQGRLRLDLALAGCGAIGTANALILSELDATGNILVMDKEQMGKENIATYSVGGQADLGRRKVDVVEEILTPKYSVKKRHGDLETLAEDVDEGRQSWPTLVLGGLDSIRARYAVQRLWPDRLIDAATGGTVVGLHDVVPGGPCIMCFFPPVGRGSAQEKLSEMTGLSLDLLGRGDDLLRGEDIAHLDEERRARLAPQIGKKICNLANAMGLIEGAGDFQAAVTFVALQAACLAVGRLIAIQLDFDGPNFVQYDSLIGPRPDSFERRRASPACYCQEKRSRIARVRAARGHRS